MADAGRGRSVKGPRWEIARGTQGLSPVFECLDDPPETLYVVGDADALREGLAVVGARKATPYGRAAARLFSGCAARRGVSVILGGARGCDAAAHEAALEQGGRTVAFLGGGCDMVYPYAMRGFSTASPHRAARWSPAPMGLSAETLHLRARNRLIAGLVSDARRRSGRRERYVFDGR